MRLLSLLLVFMSAGGAAFAQRSEVVVTKNEVRAMAPEVMTRRLFGGLAPLMLAIPDRGQPGVRPTRPLRSLSFLTRSSRTNWDGICQSELIEVEFEPAGLAAGADTRVRPGRVVTQTFYFVPNPAGLRPALPSEGESDDPGQIQARRMTRADAACTGVDPRQVRLLNAREPYRLIALGLLLDLTEDLGAGRSTVALDCSEIGPRDARLSEAQCRARFGQLGVGAVDMITNCDPPMAVVCHRLSVGDHEIDLIMAPNNQRVARARIVEMVTASDRLID